ncbi:MAG: hypothetical protein ABL921_05525, partial [Pirellula sp.]
RSEASVGTDMPGMEIGELASPMHIPSGPIADLGPCLVVESLRTPIVMLGSDEVATVKNDPPSFVVSSPQKVLTDESKRSP